jgi:hypothetical protein
MIYVALYLLPRPTAVLACADTGSEDPRCRAPVLKSKIKTIQARNTKKGTNVYLTEYKFQMYILYISNKI